MLESLGHGYSWLMYFFQASEVLNTRRSSVLYDLARNLMGGSLKVWGENLEVWGEGASPLWVKP